MLSKNTNILKLLLLLIIGGVVLFSFLGLRQNKVEDPKERGAEGVKERGVAEAPVNSQSKIEIPVTTVDFGQMKVQEEKYTDFEIKNIGLTTLKIYRVFTSCMCTFAKILIAGKESPEFNMEMHSRPETLRWQGEIAPQEKAIVRVTYKPALMPVYGPVERSVIFSTNDPQNQKVELTVKAFVQQ